MWSEETKQGLLRHHPSMLLVDAFSLVGGARAWAASVSSGEPRPGPPSSASGPTSGSIGDDGQRRRARVGQEPACWPSAAASRSATTRTRPRRRPPSGSSTATATRSPATTPRWGRTAPSTCSAGARCVINTGGEKVYPEEVEEVLKTIAGVADAVVVGHPRRAVRRGDRRRGRARPRGGSRDDRPPKLVIDHVKARLAGYKAPRRVRFVETIGRSPSGKVDYARHRADDGRVRPARPADRGRTAPAGVSPCWPRGSGRSR